MISSHIGCGDNNSILLGHCYSRLSCRQQVCDESPLHASLFLHAFVSLCVPMSYCLFIPVFNFCIFIFSVFSSFDFPYLYFSSQYACQKFWSFDAWYDGYLTIVQQHLQLRNHKNYPLLFYRLGFLLNFDFTHSLISLLYLRLPKWVSYFWDCI